MKKSKNRSVYGVIILLMVGCSIDETELDSYRTGERNAEKNEAWEQNDTDALISKVESNESGEMKFVDLRQFVGKEGDPEAKAIGLAAVERARIAGLTDKQIIQLAKEQGLTFGDAASVSLKLKKDPEDLRQFIGEKGSPDATAMGKKAVERAIASGLSKSDIIRLADEQNLSFGEQAQIFLGLAKDPNDLRQFIGLGGDPQKNVMGLSAVERARIAGFSDSDIIRLAKNQGITFGEAAAISLKLKKDPEDLRQFIGPNGDPNATVMGKAAVERALASGLNKNEIIRLADEQNLSFGDEAQIFLGLKKDPAEDLRQYIGPNGDPNATAMGLAAVDRARSAGLSDGAIIKLAGEQGLTFGGKAKDSLGI